MDKSQVKQINNPKLLNKKEGNTKKKVVPKKSTRTKKTSPKSIIKPVSSTVSKSSKTKSKNSSSKKSNIDEDEDVDIDVKSKLKQNKINNNPKFEYDKHTWNVIKTIIDEYLNKHQLEPFNKLMDEQLLQIIQQFNPVIINFNFNPNANKHKEEIQIKFKDLSIGEPIVYENNGSFHTMTPKIARDRGLTYSAPIYVNLEMTRILRSGEFYENEDIKKQVFSKITIGKIPIMVQSKYCVLKQKPNIDPKSEGECPYDKGCYFIISGNEKILIAQERMAENKVFVFNNTRQNKYLVAEIKSIVDDKFSVVMSNNLKYDKKTKILYVETPNFKEPINLFIIMRLLGVKTDKRMVELIVWDIEHVINEKIIDNIKPTLFHYKKLCREYGITQDDETVYKYLLKYLIYKGCNKDIVMNLDMRKEYLQKSIKIEMLPHLKEDNNRKSHFYGYMAQKLLKVKLGYIDYDNRDHFNNKRLDNSGVLIGSLFRQCFNRLIKDMKKSILKELKSNKSGKDSIEIIKRENICKMIKSTIIDGGLKYSLATGNWNIKNNTSYGKVKTKTGVAQVLNRLSYVSYLSHIRRVNSPSDNNNCKIIAPRKLNATQYGFICPAETPEGQPVGLVKNLALGCYITSSTNSQVVHEWSYKNGVEKLGEYNIADTLFNGKIFINGCWIGIHRNPDIFVKKFKKARGDGLINIYNCIHWNINENIIFIYTDSGRVIRPLYKVENNKLLISNSDYNKDYLNNLNNLLISNSKIQSMNSFELNLDNLANFENVEEFEKEQYYFEPNSVMEFVDCEEVQNCLISHNEQSLSVKKHPNIYNYTHVEIHPSMMLGIMGSIIPFPDHNQSPRNTYQSAMGKQAMGVSLTNVLDRMDTISYFMNNIEIPIVGTRYNEILNCNKLSNGLNVVVAIASHTGYNQEDSLIFNQGALDRGLFRATHYKIYKDDEKKIQSSGKEEKFCKPDPKYTKNMKPYCYDKLNDMGFVRENTYVSSSDVIIGKVLPMRVKNSNEVIYKDCSTSLRPNESGIIDKTYTNRNSNGDKFCKIKKRSERIPTIGDKFSSRCGQKGTVGMTLQEENMPFNKEGFRPDIIMNPHAIPSRMTIGQLLECILGKTAVMMGGIADCTPFCEIDKEKIYDLLEHNGFNRHGNELLYNGITGKQMDCMVFMGPTFYQRLKHMVADKVHSRANGPIVQLTRQPPEGRSRDGGLRIGEMERDCMIAHGALSFLKESMLERSDLFPTYVCQDCGCFAVVNEKKMSYKCNKCPNSSNFSLIHIPYACKLLIQELQGMAILPKIYT